LGVFFIEQLIFVDRKLILKYLVKLLTWQHCDRESEFVCNSIV